MRAFDVHSICGDPPVEQRFVKELIILSQLFRSHKRYPFVCIEGLTSALRSLGCEGFTSVASLEATALNDLDSRNEDAQPYTWTIDAKAILGQVGTHLAVGSKSEDWRWLYAA